MKKIFSESELINLLKSAKCGGQYVCVYGKSDVKLNKFPTDGSERVRIDDNFKPYKLFSVKFHFGEDYEKKMCKVLGVDTYNASDANRIHLVKNVVMQYVSTGNTCIIYMPEDYSFEGTYINGHKVTADEQATIDRYKSKSNSNSVVEYRTLSFKNITAISIGGEHYEISLNEQTLAG